MSIVLADHNRCPTFGTCTAGPCQPHGGVQDDMLALLMISLMQGNLTISLQRIATPIRAYAHALLNNQHF